MCMFALCSVVSLLTIAQLLLIAGVEAGTRAVTDVPENVRKEAINMFVLQASIHGDPNEITSQPLADGTIDVCVPHRYASHVFSQWYYYTNYEYAYLGKFGTPLLLPCISGGQFCTAYAYATAQCLPDADSVYLLADIAQWYADHEQQKR